MMRLIQMGLRMQNGDEGICQSVQESKHNNNNGKIK